MNLIYVLLLSSLYCLWYHYQLSKFFRLQSLHVLYMPIKLSWYSNVRWHRTWAKLAQVMACLLTGGTKPLLQPMSTYDQWSYVAFARVQGKDNHAFKNYPFKLAVASPWVQYVNHENQDLNANKALQTHPSVHMYLIMSIIAAPITSCPCVIQGKHGRQLWPMKVSGCGLATGLLDNAIHPQNMHLVCALLTLALLW